MVLLIKMMTFAFFLTTKEFKKKWSYNRSDENFTDIVNIEFENVKLTEFL